MSLAPLHLACRCGNITGVAMVSPSTVNRLSCCCDDCQQYGGMFEGTLDAYGGTEVFQLAVARLTLKSGQNHLACKRLTPTGLYRWYAACCDTPIGNTLGPSMPFIGVIHTFVNDVDFEPKVGRHRGFVQIKFASKRIPPELNPKGLPLAIMFRAAVKLMGWKLKGLHRPSEFFDDNGEMRTT